MAIFKCKMCGGDLNVQEGITVCECEYCGTKQTVPMADNEKKVNAFNRANHLRSNCEFDKAAGVYENIVSEFPEEAEAYWGLCLCKFGIEYVDDPATGKKIPTCHRTSYDSIFEDGNFEQALEWADSVAHSVYRVEAKEIDRLQKEILEIAKNEQPFDVFICYKESDENGQRTVDSEIAHDIYDVLTEKGYKVFYSRITLKAKLGQDYEPYIFSALNSARVMIAIGTKYEYYNAVWVKNEWSRYLALMSKDSGKTLIPCYRDIDAYDMPKEFKHLQAQDLSSPRAFQDLVNNIEKIIPKSTNGQLNMPVQQQVIMSASPTVEPLIKRAFMCLEDEQWQKADELCEQVLNQDPENANAYLCKLLSEYKLNKESKLATYVAGFTESDNYKKIIRFGDSETKGRMEDYRIRAIYNKGCSKMSGATSESEYREVKSIFDSIKNFKDSEKLAQKCDNCIKEIIYNRAVGIYNTAKTADDLSKALDLFKTTIGYKDSEKLVQKCDNCIKEKIYNRAVGIYNTAKTADDLSKALDLFETIIGYKDSDILLDRCKMKDYLIPYNAALERMKTATQKEEFEALAEQFRSFGKIFESEKYVQICVNQKNKLELEEEKQRAERKQYQEEQINYVIATTSLQPQNEEKTKLMKRWRKKGVCQHCGGNFVSIFNEKCSRCGKPKDY